MTIYQTTGTYGETSFSDASSANASVVTLASPRPGDPEATLAITRSTQDLAQALANARRQRQIQRAEQDERVLQRLREERRLIQARERERRYSRQPAYYIPPHPHFRRHRAHVGQNIEDPLTPQQAPMQKPLPVGRPKRG